MGLYLYATDGGAHRISSVAFAHGLYAILHTDGDITRMLERLSETGLHGVQAVDPVSGMDMAHAKGVVDGKLCLCGNVDCGMLIMDTKDKIYDSTCDILKDCKAGGLVLGASNAVVIETPIGKYREVVWAWEDAGQYR